MMKRFLMVMPAIAMVIAMVSGAYAESTPASVTASGTVVKKLVVGGTAAINLGATLDPTSALSEVDLSGMTLWCTKGASVTVTVGNGDNYSGTTRNLKGGTGNDLIPYTVTWNTTITGLGKNTDLLSALAMKATITAGGLDVAPAGAYTDALTLQFEY